MLRSPRTVLAICCVAIALVVAPCVAADLSRAEQAQVQYDKAALLEKQGNYDGAIAQWQEILSKFPPASGTDAGQLAIVKSEILLSIGERQRQLGRLDEAAAAFKKAIESCPDCRSSCAEATLCLGKIYQKKKDNVNAISQYIVVLTKYPERTSRANIARSKIDEIRRTATDLQIPTEVWNEMGRAYAVNDDAAREEERITAARRGAMAKGKKGQKDEAKADLEALFADAAVLGSGYRLFDLGSAQMVVGDEAGARKSFAKYFAIVDKESDPENKRLAYARVHFKLGAFKEVVTETTEALKIYPDGSSAAEFTKLQLDATAAIK